MEFIFGLMLGGVVVFFGLIWLGKKIKESEERAQGLRYSRMCVDWAATMPVEAETPTWLAFQEAERRYGVYLGNGRWMHDHRIDK